IERVLRERLSRDTATRDVQVAVADETKGLSACFIVSATAATDPHAAIARLMAPFAIAWRIEP
ncbi:MAG TPA: hypothetical protein VF107_09705, partial [Burkholderiaceae bacterium]